MSLHRAALILDLSAAVNRIYLHGDEQAEILALTPEQLTIYAGSLDAPGDHPVYEQIAALIGQKANK